MRHLPHDWTDYTLIVSFVLPVNTLYFLFLFNDGYFSSLLVDFPLSLVFFSSKVYHGTIIHHGFGLVWGCLKELID